MKRHIKAINVLLIFSICFASLPLQLINFNGHMHAYADEGISVSDKVYENYNNKEDPKSSGDPLSGDFPSGATDALIQADADAESVAADKAWLTDE